MTAMTLDEVLTAFPTWMRLIHRLGRNDLPDVLMLHWHDLEPEELAYAISDAWSAAEYPEQYHRTTDWKMLMRHVGYTVDGVPADRPSRPLRLWRGATLEGSRGMAWSTSRETAEWFRDRLNYFGLDWRLWTAEVTPRRMLMACNDRDEHEVVINTSWLTIVEAAGGDPR